MEKVRSKKEKGRSVEEAGKAARRSIPHFSLLASCFLFFSAFAAGPVEELYRNHITLLADFDGGTADSAVNSLKSTQRRWTVGDDGLFGTKALVGGSFSYNIGGRSKKVFDTSKPGTVLFWIKLTEDFPADIKVDPGCTHFSAMWAQDKRMLIFRQDGRTCGASGQAPMSVYYHCPKKNGSDHVIKNYVIRSDVGPSFRKWRRGEWHLIAAIWRPDGFAISYDGAPFRAVESTEPIGPGVWLLNFSVPGPADGSRGICAMDDCAALDFALSDGQVKELWDEYQARMRESAAEEGGARAEFVACGGKGRSRYEIAVRATNPSRKRADVVFAAKARPVNSQPASTRQAVSLAPGESRVFTLSGPCLDGETVVADFGVQTADGGRTLLRRHRVFAPNAPEPEWMRAPSPVSFKFAYYPHEGTIHAAADISGCEGFERATSLVLAIRRAGGKGATIASKSFAPASGGKNEFFWRGLPELDGDYVCRFEARGVPEAVAEQSFSRRHFEWERNTLGMTRTIPAPFTPVERDGSRVKVVLREHDVGALGLWRQVLAAGKPLLARPMAVVAGGRALSEADGLSASSEWDVDGLMEWRLTLRPGRYGPMALEIPVRAERAPLMHACVDGLRRNYGGKVPAGSGRVWDGTKCRGRNSIVGDYVPYLWVGGPLRGISVFGENDRGWVLDGGASGGADVPCQEIVREGDGTVTVRLNIVQRMADLKEPRTIRLGFMATPVKPMPDGWRARDNGWLLGACLYWGAETTCCSVEPFDGTGDYFRTMAAQRRTGKVDTEALERALAAFPYRQKRGTAAWTNEVKSIRAHMFNGFHNCAGSAKDGRRLVFYTNARGVHYGDPKGQGATFCNEWNRFEYFSRAISRTTEKAYDLDPVASYRDYAAWWYAKMVGTGACDHIYWDDVFLSSVFNLVQSDAYRLAYGAIQPASGVFNMRALIRRAAAVQTELGRDATGNWVHMTNTAIAPVLSFAGVNYDWEDLSGERPHQEKYPKDYILACTIGRQFGNRVGIMGYFVHGLDQKSELGQWLERTGAGVMLTHELRWNRWSGHKIYEKAHDFLCDWGYRTPSVDVWNYWDEDVPFPVEVSGVDAATIAMAKKSAGEAMVCVSSFEGRDGEVTLVPDAKVLGLGGDWTAEHALTGVKAPVVGGRITLSLAKYDWALLRLR